MQENEKNNVVTMQDGETIDITDLDPSLVLVEPGETRQQRRNKRRKIQFGGALIGLMLGLAGLLAGRMGHIWPLFDVISQFGLQFVMMVAAFGLAFFLPRMKSFFGTVFFLLAILAYGLWPHVVSVQPPPQNFSLPTGERAIRVAHFNMYQGNGDLDAIASEIERLDADIMTLIEFTDEKLPILDRLRLAYPYQFSCHQQPACHLAIIAKHPISAPLAIGTWEGPPYIEARFATLGGLTVIGVHTTRFPQSRAQLHQVTTLIKNMQSERGNVILMGDFNATPFSRVIDTIVEGVGYTRQTSLPTWPTKLVLPQLAIDHIFTSAGIRALTDEQIGNAAGSDHYPISMTLAVPVQ